MTTGVTLNLPTANLTITSSGTWDGILNGASLVATGGLISSTGLVSVSSIYSIGSPVASLILSGSLATVSITVSSTFQTSTLPLYRSDDHGLTYISIGACIIGSDSLCTFTTNHFSLFALGMPSFPVVSSGGSNTYGPGG